MVWLVPTIFFSLCVLCALSLLSGLTSFFREANFVLPEVGDFLDAVTFVELQIDEAEKLVKQYNDEGRHAAPPPEKRFDNRETAYRGQSGSFQRYDNRGGYQNRGGSGGGYRPGLYLISSRPCRIKYMRRNVSLSCQCLIVCTGQVSNVEVTTRTAGVGITETTAREVATTEIRAMEETTTVASKVPIQRMDTAR